MEYMLFTTPVLALIIAIFAGTAYFNTGSGQLNFNKEFKPSTGVEFIFLSFILLGLLFLSGEVVKYATLTVVFAVLWVISRIDFNTQYIPNSLSYPLLAIGFIVSFTGMTVSPMYSVIGVVAGYLFLFGMYKVFLRLTGTETMGYGDFKLLAAIGAWVGPLVLPWVIVVAGVTALLYLSARKLINPNFSNQIPFGPFLSIGGFLYIFFTIDSGSMLISHGLF